MEYLKTLSGLPARFQNAVIAIGNFDGIHKGHQELLRTARALADKHKIPCGILTFEPHPRRIFRPDDPPFRITPAAIKQRRLATHGVDFTVALDFTWDFASQSAQNFIDTILKNGIKPAHIVVGHDFRFGQLRVGNPAMIRDSGLAVTELDKVADEDGADVSSTRIRNALAEGDMKTANELLGWEWEIEGIVVKGDQRGRTIGYPTANVHLNDTIHPAYGIYATRVQIEGESEWRNAATNIGIRPMFEVQTGQVEAYIFDFDREIYGKKLRVRPIERLRGEARFESLQALVRQIEDDCHKARNILSLT